MAKNNSGDKGNASSGNSSSGDTPRKPPETPKPKSLGKFRRDGQDYD